MPNCTLTLSEVVGQKLIDLFVKVGLLKSKGEASRLISNGGAYLNNNKMTMKSTRYRAEDMIEGRLILMGAGKKNKLLVRLRNEGLRICKKRTC